MLIAVYHNLPSGGAKRCLYESIKRLSGQHQIDVYTLSTADAEFCDLRPFARDHKQFPFAPSRLFKTPFGRLNQLQRWRDLQRIDRLTRRIAQRLDAQGYDLVFAHPCMFSQAPLVIRHLKTPVVYFCQEPPRALYDPQRPSANGAPHWRTRLDQIDPLIRLYRSTARQLDWQATRCARRVLVNSKFMQDTTARIYDIKPLLSYLGVDTEIFRPQVGMERQNFVLSVGAIQPHKGFDFLIKSLAHIAQNHRPSLRLVGNMQTTSERQSLENLASQEGVDLQIEVGISLERLVHRYNEAAVVVYGPYREPFGFVPLEAMACGTPVVGIAEGGVLETVAHNQTGILVERDTTIFADALSQLLADEKRRASYGYQARAHVIRHWSWEVAVKRIEQHLLNATQL